MRHIQGRKTNNKLSSNKLPVIQLKLKKMERKKRVGEKERKGGNEYVIMERVLLFTYEDVGGIHT